MQFSSALIAASALALVNGAKITNGPAFFQNIVAGQALNLTWIATGSGSVSIFLKEGIATNLQTVPAAPALSGLTGTSVSYIIPTTIPDGTYAFEIDETGQDPNYSVQFALTGGAASSSVGSTSTVTSGSSTSTVLSSSSGSSSTASTTAITAGNSTTTASKTGSTTSASKTGSSTTTSSTSTPSSLNSAADVASPLAFVFFAVTAVFFLQ